MRAFLKGLLLLILLISTRAQADVAGDVNQATARLKSAPGLQTDWTGTGETSGEVMSLRLSNSGTAPITVQVVPGMLLAPGDSKTQRMMLESQAQATVPPGQSLAVPLRGYCLDYGKEPPSATMTSGFQLVDDVSEQSEAIKVILAGLKLSEQGLYSTDLPPLHQRTVVVQRALWVLQARRGGAPYTRETLMQDIRSELGLETAEEKGDIHADRPLGGDPDIGQQGGLLEPSALMQSLRKPGASEALADRIWRDVELTLAEAAKM